jgi:hypothetical protein
MRQEQSRDYDAAIEELRRLAREPFEIDEEQQELRARRAAERAASNGKVLEEIARRAPGDLRVILEEEARRRAERRRDASEVLARLEAKAGDRASAEQRRLLRIRAQYLDTFGRPLAAQEEKAQLKFRETVFWSGDARPGTCTYFGGGFFSFSPWLGPSSEAGADIVQGTGGLWLHPTLSIDSNSCDDMREGTTFQHVTYRRDPPDVSFGVTSVRVDLIGNGIATSHFGDTGWLTSPSQLYEHSVITLDVYIGQQVHGEWHLWPLLADRLFVGKGEYVRQVRPVLSGQTYPSSIVIRRPEVGGGDLLCLVQVACSVLPIGTDGRVGIDFAAAGRGMFLGGVALLGAAL